MWASKRRRGGNPVVGFLTALLALFGVLVIVLSVMDRSVAEAGARIDGWIGKGVALVGGATEEAVDQAPIAAEAVAVQAGEAAGKTGDALEAGAAKTAEELRKAD